MNYIVFCDKSEIKSYEKLFESAVDSKMLAAEPTLEKEKISELIRTHNPHGVIFANTNYEITQIKEALKLINEKFGDVRTIVIYPDLDNENAEKIKNCATGLITRAVTSEDFTYIVDNKLGSYDFQILNQKKIIAPAKKKKYKTARGITDPKVLAITGGAVFVGVLIILIVGKSCGGTAKPEETEPSTTLASELANPDEETLSEFPTEETATVSITFTTQEPTEKSTEKLTEKPTEKPTEKKKKLNTSSSTSSQVYTPPVSPQSPASSQPASSQPVYEPEPVPVQTDPPYTPPASSEIIDGGKIYLDPTSVTLKIGQTYEIYVTGLSAANGCNWSVQNAAVVDFVSGDTTKVVIKTKAVGTTIITATSKSSGATAQCIVTVKR